MQSNSGRPGAIIVYIALFGLFMVVAISTPFIGWWAVVGLAAWVVIAFWTVRRLIQTAKV